MPDLSIVVPFYLNSGMLRRHLQIWRDEWPEALKVRCDVVIVDDASPEPAAPIVSDAGPIGMPVSVYRVLKDIPWHQHAARNLGAHVAKARWLLLTDMDHVIPADTLAAVLAQTEIADRRMVMTFARRDAPAGRPWRSDDWPTMAQTRRDDGSLKPHVNSFAMARKFYWRDVGGYDESYVGVYGTDRLFRDRLWRHGRQLDLSPWPLIRVGREVIADASTTTLSRKDGREPGAKKRIAAGKAARGESNVVKVLQFEWEHVL